MRFHNEEDKYLHPRADSQIEAPPGIKRAKRSESLLPDEEVADDSLMITLCYEAHLAMQRMLTAFAEIRGDDAVRSA